MSDIYQTLIKLDSFLTEKKIEYAIIGGTAAILYGRLRATEDIDVTLMVNLEDIAKIHEIVVEAYMPRLKESKEFFQRNFVLPVIDKQSNVRIDFSAGLSEFDKNVIKRRVRKKIGEIEVFICSLEDLILYKLFSSRPIDFIDVEELIKHPIQKLDLKYLTETASKFVELEREDVLLNLQKYLKCYKKQL